MSTTTTAPPLEVLRHAFLGIAEEMGATLQRSAYTVVIKDLNDYSCAIFDALGALVAQGNNMPTHLGSMGHALRSLIELWGDDVAEGDAYISNDPYSGGQHAPDVHVFMPVHVEGRIIAWAGSIAHHADWGGRVPGSMSVDNASIYEEGVVYPHVRIEHRGQPLRDVYRLIATNIRQPELGLGDLRAQVAAGRTAVTRLTALSQRYSTTILTDAIAALIAHSEARTRRAISEFPDGTYEAEGFLDGNGLPGSDALRIRAQVSVKGSDVLVDFAGTVAQQATAINVPLATTRSAVLYALQTVLDEDIPNTEGCAAPISVTVAEGSLLNPTKPAPVADRHLTSQRLADVLVRAFAQMAPAKASAGWFVGAAWMACFPPSPKTGDPIMLLLNLVGGGGASPCHAGPDAVDAHMSNATLIPAEVVETDYPLRVERYSLVAGSGGHGAHDGGRGIRAEFTNIADVGFDIQVGMEQTRPESAAWGLQGGGGGQPGMVAIRRGDVEEIVASRRRHRIEPGETLIMQTGGGGAHGEPPQSSSTDHTITQRRNS